MASAFRAALPSVVLLALVLVPDRSAPGGEDDARGRFIVALELSPRHGFEVLWPHACLPPFAARRVLLVVERLPRPLEGDGAPRQLPPARVLRVNGQPPEARAEGDGRHSGFIVELDQGRLRLSLVIPPGLRLEPGKDDALITLYETTKEKP